MVYRRFKRSVLVAPVSPGVLDSEVLTRIMDILVKDTPVERHWVYRNLYEGHADLVCQAVWPILRTHRPSAFLKYIKILKFSKSLPD